MPRAPLSASRFSGFALPLTGLALLALAIGTGVHTPPPMGADAPPKAAPTDIATWVPPLSVYTPKPQKVPSGSGHDSGGEIVAVLLAVVAVGVVLFLVHRLLKALRDRDQSKSVLAVDPEAASRDLQDDFVEEAQQSFVQAARRLDAGDDLDAAIIECWRRLEQAAATSGVPRRPQDTATEYATRVLQNTPVDADDLGVLRTLYQRAMFGGAQTSAADRDTAVSALMRLGEALGSPAGAH